jgi:hypothetical protein
MKSEIERFLLLFPEVKWDRWAGDINKSMTVFGWISRDDGRSDFVCLIIYKGDVEKLVTSSAKYSSEFAKRLGYMYHGKCERVENHFNVENCVNNKPFNPLDHDNVVANEAA